MHDNFNNLVAVLRKIKENKDVKQVIFLRDFINNWIAKFLRGFSLPVYAIWGNNDGDKCAIIKTGLDKKSNMKIGDNIYDF